MKVKSINKKRIRTVLICFLAILLCVTAFMTSVASASKSAQSNYKNNDLQTLEDLKSKLETAENNKNALIAIIDKSAGTLHEYDSRKQKLEINITYAREEINVINALIDEYSAIIKKAEKDLIEQEVKLELAKNDFAKIVKYLYENGNTSLIELMVSSDSLSDFFARYDYADSLLEYNDSLMNEINASTEKLSTVKADHESALKSLDQYKSELEAKQTQLQSEIDELDALMAEYADGVDRTQEQLDAAQKAEEELLKEIAEMQTKISEQEAARQSELERLESIWAAEQSRTATTTTMSTEVVTTDSAVVVPTGTAVVVPTVTVPSSDLSDYYSSVFSWPLPIKGRITSRYGYRTDSPFSSGEHHNGLDIAAPKNTPILAAADGVVTRSEYSGNFGNVVVIDHGNGLSTLYCHCNTRLVAKGAKVLKDQVIAKVGTTGQSSGNHLHFAVIKNGSYVNPEPYLPKGYLK